MPVLAGSSVKLPVESANSTIDSGIIGWISLSNMFKILDPTESADGKLAYLVRAFNLQILASRKLMVCYRCQRCLVIGRRPWLNMFDNPCPIQSRDCYYQLFPIGHLPICLAAILTFTPTGINTSFPARVVNDSICIPASIRHMEKQLSTQLGHEQLVPIARRAPLPIAILH